MDGYIVFEDHAVDNIDIDNAKSFIDFTFEDTGHYDDASMGIIDPTVEREPFKPIPIMGTAGIRPLSVLPGGTEYLFRVVTGAAFTPYGACGYVPCPRMLRFMARIEAFEG